MVSKLGSVPFTPLFQNYLSLPRGPALGMHFKKFFKVLFVFFFILTFYGKPLEIKSLFRIPSQEGTQI